MIQVPMEILNPFFYFTLLTLSFMFMTPLLASSEPFSEALLSLKSEIIDNSNTLNDWFLPPEINPSPTTQIHACSWSGVKCSENSSKIIALDLSMKNLGGSLSGSQFNLFIDLVDLNLSHNSFSSHLPNGIFNLTRLQSLDISRNNFSGLFPNGISNLKTLIVLDAFSNSFSGPLPDDVSRIETLKVMNFAGSYFSGPIPSGYGSFKSLEFIHLAGNFLSGKIPPELGNLKKMSHMEIGYNSYEGEIPWQFGNMSALIYLDIADANISGSIPNGLSNLTKLESLFLFRNQISGKIPGEFGKMLSLQSLDLSDNLISGEIPETFSELKNLKLLSLMYNELSGSVPQGVAKLPQLDTLLIWNNYFTGSLPGDLGRFSKLRHLDVSTNYFVGSIPPGICNGRELEKLILFSNNFTGGLSPSLSNCSSLVRLRVEDNLFSGEISLQFGNLPGLSYVDLSRNRFTGGILPFEFVKASRLEYFNVSYNPGLGGILPSKIWSLSNLQNFSMVSCGVSGNIPPFEYCKSVLVIELGMNNLSGEIPKSISNCKHLVRIDLAYNDLSGSIPTEKTFKNMDESAFIGNPKLCGAPLKQCHNGISNGLQLGSRRAQKLAWVLILCGVIVLFITAAVFGIVYFKRGSKGHWKMISFNGLPQFTAKDVLRSFNCVESLGEVSTLPHSIGKVALPTGITVSVRKIEWDPKEMKFMLQSLTRIGNVRHRNLTRLLGICYNNRIAYVLYDYLPNGNLAEKIRVGKDWETKCKIVMGVAKALCFLHHDCYPAIAHGNLKASNVLFDENMEPHLAEYGLGSIVQSMNSPLPAKTRKETGGLRTSLREELYMDVYNFGELIMEILANGRSTNAATISQNTQNEDLIREIADENGIGPSNSFQEEMLKSFIEVALLCMKSKPSDRPSMQDAQKMLSRLKSQPDGRL
ncbi:hypothetical protein BUALT_Bualt16G0082300 [Buddleja alternifolia]|uniref:Protein kinase domain-containing protein n=1 Tax=Buddleja alternifolia TaxID=168488 RepID=A0AAV6WKU8_9LAMI|nr:hypothetical protein BUALT_Bualt16G0082300 [Buddleja alternifolia]